MGTSGWGVWLFPEQETGEAPQKAGVSCRLDVPPQTTFRKEGKLKVLPGHATLQLLPCRPWPVPAPGPWGGGRQRLQYPEL